MGAGRHAARRLSADHGTRRPSRRGAGGRGKAEPGVKCNEVDGYLPTR